MFYVLISKEITATACFTFSYLKKLLPQQALQSDISGNYCYSMFYVLISQEIIATASSSF
jgi:hypothetical protein